MTTNVDALRAALDLENKRLEGDLRARNEAQIDLAGAQAILGVRDLAVGARYREINYLQSEIDLTEAAPEPDPDPTDPAGIPLIPLVPATPVEPEPDPEPDADPEPEPAPAEPIEGETNE